MELANDVNSNMPDYVVRRVQAMLNDLERSVRGSRILAYGLAYKANTGDARETPTVPIIEKLLALGAHVDVVDPHVADRQFPEGSTRVEGSDADLDAADLVVFLVDHADFDTEAIAAAGAPILDCRHALVGDNVRHL